MTALIIILCILAFFASLFFIRLTFVIKYDDGLYAVLKILCFRFQLYPEKPPKQEMSVKELKKLRKRLNKKKRDKQTAETLKKKSTTQKKRTFSDVTALVDEIRAIVTEISGRLFKHLRIHIKKLDIVVAAGDPAKTAIAFGLTCQLLNSLIARIEATDYRYKFGDMECRCDYLADKFSCQAHIELKIRVWQALSVLICSLTSYLKSDLNKGGIINEQDK